MLALLLSAALSSPQAFVWYDRLLAEGGYGRFERERAAFLIEERDGTLTLEPWPVSAHRHASFRGTIPPRAIAIIHTHPRNLPDPSAHDRAEARRLNIAIVVVTPRGVVIVEGNDEERLRRAGAAGSAGWPSQNAPQSH
ncbi:MAG TPA: Mov34/MPN/PAD-1 family protein [Thermoanaerobaculia bacterium]|nr:Mov34/MPN/PAD-1 family protein [Thermoanaerobaculia bacterium]